MLNRCKFKQNLGYNREQGVDTVGEITKFEMMICKAECSSVYFRWRISLLKFYDLG